MNTKNKILLEAVENYDRRLSKIEMVLKEALTHPIFRFENELEYQLFEGAVYGVGRAPASAKMNVRGGGSGRFGEYTKTLGRFRELVTSISDVNMLTSPQDFISSLEDIFDILDLIVNIFSAEDAEEPTKKEARILLYKLSSFLTKNVQITIDLKRRMKIEKNSLEKEIKSLDKEIEKFDSLRSNIVGYINTFTKQIPKGYTALEAQKDFLASEAPSLKADELEAEIKRKKRGFFGGLADKIKGLF